MARNIHQPPPALVTVAPANRRTIPTNQPYTVEGVRVPYRWTEDTSYAGEMQNSRVCGMFASDSGTEWTCYLQPSVTGWGNSGRTAAAFLVMVCDTAEVTWGSVTTKGLRPKYPVRVGNQPTNPLAEHAASVIREDERGLAVFAGGTSWTAPPGQNGDGFYSPTDHWNYRWVVTGRDLVAHEGTMPEFFNYNPRVSGSYSVATLTDHYVSKCGPNSSQLGGSNPEVCGWLQYLGDDANASLRVFIDQNDWPGGMGGPTDPIYLWAGELSKVTDPSPLTGDYWADSGTNAGWTNLATLNYPGASTDYNVVHTGLSLTAGKAYVFRITDSNAADGWDTSVHNPVLGEWEVSTIPNALDRPPPWDIMGETGLCPGGVIDLGY